MNQPQRQYIEPGSRVAGEAWELLNRIQDHHLDWKESIGKGPRYRVHPDDGGKPLRDFKPNNFLDEWMEVTDEPIIQVAFLEHQGAITTVKLDGKFYARPAA